MKTTVLLICCIYYILQHTLLIFEDAILKWQNYSDKFTKSCRHKSTSSTACLKGVNWKSAMWLRQHWIFWCQKMQRMWNCCESLVTVCTLSLQTVIYLINFERVGRTDWETFEVLGSWRLYLRRCRWTHTAALIRAGVCSADYHHNRTQTFKNPSMLKKTFVIFMVENCGQ